MDYEHSYSLLIVSSNEKFNESLKPLLSEKRFNSVRTVNSVAAGRRAILEYDYDVCIINTPLTDEFGTRLALDICDKSGTAVMVMVKAEHYPDIDAKLSQYGVLVLSKPTSVQIVSQSLTLLCGTRERLRRMEQKAASVEVQMEEIRIVNHAKWLLIEHEKMSEKDAHRYIEKQAMDRCTSRRIIAEGIIVMYEK